MPWRAGSRSRGNMHGMTAVGKVIRALGLMSGTSLDGIDVALIETDGENALERGPAKTFTFEDSERVLLAAAIREAHALTMRTLRPGCLGEAERMVTRKHAQAIATFMREHGLARETIGVAGFHGQTVLHRPDAGLTVQIGDGAALARLTGLAVVHDLRAADVAAGGQGAPLAPVYHRALVARQPMRPVAVLNVGGVANLTWIGADGRLIAFDTGPGNALVDDWVREKAGAAYDEGGALAALGRPDERALHLYLSHGHFAAPPPKSLDRNAFAPDLVWGMNVEDGAATLTAFTAGAIGRAREHLPEEPKLWIVCGGGRRNKTLMSMIAGLVENAVVPAEAAGLDGDSVEAEAWAYLAVRSLEGLPITFPGTTGVSRPMTGGVLARAP